MTPDWTYGTVLRHRQLDFDVMFLTWSGPWIGRVDGMRARDFAAIVVSGNEHLGLAKPQRAGVVMSSCVASDGPVQGWLPVGEPGMVGTR